MRNVDRFSYISGNDNTMHTVAAAPIDRVTNNNRLRFADGRNPREFRRSSRHCSAFLYNITVFFPPISFHGYRCDGDDTTEDDIITTAPLYYYTRGLLLRLGRRGSHRGYRSTTSDAIPSPFCNNSTGNRRNGLSDVVVYSSYEITTDGSCFRPYKFYSSVLPADHISIIRYIFNFCSSTL